MKRWMKNNLDYVASLVGITAIFCSFILPGHVVSNIFCWMAAIFGVVYLGYAMWLWFIRRVDFDWHLLNGQFLRKVVTLVLVLPFTVTVVSQMVISSSNELVNKGNGSRVERAEVRNDAPDSSELFWSVYYHFIDPGNQHMTQGFKGRAWAAIIAMLGVFLLNGLLVSSIIGWVDQRRDKWREGRIRYKRRYLGKYRFALVIGANELAAAVISNLLARRADGNNRYVILQTSRDVPTVRKEIESHLSDADMQRVIIYHCNRDSADELGNMHVRYATAIYVLGESTLVDGGESFHDSMNMRCVNLLAELLDKSYDERVQLGEPVRRECRVMFEYQTTYSVIQFADISAKVKRNLDFMPFNRYESWARRIMSDGVVLTDTESQYAKSVEYTPLDGKNGIGVDSDDHVHFVVVGMSKMGVAMGTQAILQAHYLNYANAELKGNNELKSARRTRVTFIDTEADKNMAFFKGRYENLFSLMRHRIIDANTEPLDKIISTYDTQWDDPMLSEECPWKHLSKDGTNFLDIEVEFIKGGLESEGVREILRHISNPDNVWAKNSKMTIAVCMPETHEAVAAALYMPISVYKKVQEIWVYQRESADIILNLMDNGHNDRRYKRLRPFGMLYGAYLSGKNQYYKALLVNGVYDLKCATVEGVRGRTICDDMVEKWSKLSIDKQFSNIYFVDAIPQKIRAVSDVKELSGEAMSICEHNRWNIQQLMLGYNPCSKEVDDLFQRLNNDNIAANSISEEEAKMQKKEFKNRKVEYKEGEDRVHPNICDFAHLDSVDYGAKGYDVVLNGAIPEILEIADGLCDN